MNNYCHNRLDHPNDNIVSKMTNGAVTGMKESNTCTVNCQVYIQSKMINNPAYGTLVPDSEEKIIHCDIVGPMLDVRFGNTAYFISMTVGKRRFATTELL